MLQFLTYIIVYPIAKLISLLPFPILYFISDLFYYLIFYVIGYRKKLVLENMQKVFPEKSLEELKKLRQEFYHHFVDIFMEMIKTSSMSLKEMHERMYLTNPDLFSGLSREHPGVVVMTSHHANYEWLIGLNVLLDNDAYGVYKMIKNKYLNNFIVKSRARFNCILITTKETRQIIHQNYKRGKHGTYALISDQSPKKRSIRYYTHFFGHEIPVYTSAEQIAKEYNYPITFFDTKKIGRGKYQTTYEVLTYSPRDFQDYEITDLFIKKVEKQIREQPAYYFWTHDRFKHQKTSESTIS